MAENRDTPRCGAAPKKNGPRQHPCKLPPVAGGNRCRFHGGKSPRAQAAARNNLLEQEAQRALDAIERRAVTPVDDPLTELSKLAGQVLAWKDAMGKHVQELNSLRYSGENGEYIRGEVLLFERAMDRCASVLGLIAKLNIDERLARIADRQAEALEAALLAAFDAAGIGLRDTAVRERVTTAFHGELSVLTAA